MGGFLIEIYVGFVVHSSIFGVGRIAFRATYHTRYIYDVDLQD